MPIKFEIYRNGERVNAFAPVGAYAVGPESVPIPSDIAFKDGILSVTRGDDNAIGLSLLWDMGPLGSFQLETTRLQPRLETYNLNVELARMRLMKVVQKQEDWNLFEFPKAERFLAALKEAQNLFADALGMLDNPTEASKLADAALSSGVDLSEQLGGFHSDLLINRRRTANQFVKHIFGCRVDPELAAPKYKEMLTGNFDFAVLPLNWRSIQPREGAFETEKVDDWVELLNRKRMPVIAGPLISFGDGAVPDWMFIWEHDFDTLRELAYEYVQKVVHRYRKAVAVWNVAAGLHTNKVFMLSFEQIIELTRLLVSQVKNMLPNARTLVTIQHSFGEYHARGRNGVPPMPYAEMVAQAGINFEAFGLELELGVPAPGMFMRDLFQISCMLDKFSTLGRPVFLTALCAPGRATPDPGDESEGKLNPSAGGRWHRPWDPQLQADWIEAVYRVALSKPFVESITWSNLADVRATVPGGGLLDDMFQPKPSYTRLMQLKERFHQWAGKR